MRIAIPTYNGALCPHFGHCAEFTFVDVDEAKKEITSVSSVPAPEHAPGLLPPWIRDHGANTVIAGGMGMRAQQIFAENGIKVIVGAPAAAPREVVQAFLDGTLETGANLCDH